MIYIFKFNGIFSNIYSNSLGDENSNAPLIFENKIGDQSTLSNIQSYDLSKNTQLSLNESSINKIHSNIDDGILKLN